MPVTDQPAPLGALLVDLENLYRAMAGEYDDPAELTLLVLQNLRTHVRDVMGVSIVIGRAYAPLDSSSARMFINDLALMGIQPVHVLARPEKNSAELMLSIDCTELLFDRRDIGTFIIVGGDRDYIPVAERVMQKARRIFVVCPRHAMSGDLLTIIGDDCYMDAVRLVPADQRTPVSWKKIVQREKPGQESNPEPSGPESEPAAPPAPSPAAPPLPATMADVEKIVADSYEMDDLKRCTSLILDFMRDNNIREVWLGPFFRILNNVFPLKSNADRKSLIGRLCQLGAIRIEDRPRGEGGDTFSVIMVNWRHPLVMEMNPG